MLHIGFLSTYTHGHNADESGAWLLCEAMPTSLGVQSISKKEGKWCRPYLLRLKAFNESSERVEMSRHENRNRNQCLIETVDGRREQHRQPHVVERSLTVMKPCCMGSQLTAKALICENSRSTAELDG